MAKGKKTGGRTKGVPNAITQDVREAIAVFAERNVGQLEAWLKRVARYDPGKAADIFLKAIEYHIPKLNRTEVTGDVKHTAGPGLQVIIQQQFGQTVSGPERIGVVVNLPGPG